MGMWGNRGWISLTRVVMWQRRAHILFYLLVLLLLLIFLLKIYEQLDRTFCNYPQDCPTCRNTNQSSGAVVLSDVKAHESTGNILYASDICALEKGTTAIPPWSSQHLHGGCLPPLKAFIQEYRSAPKYKVSYCNIEKNMSTRLTAIMCYLYHRGTIPLLDSNRTLEDYTSSFCSPKTTNFAVRPFMTTDWIKFTVVREPIERFVSGWMDKCYEPASQDVGFWRKKVCYNCGENLTCFVDELYKDSWNYAYGGKNPTGPFEARHFFPQNWRCNFQYGLQQFSLIPYKVMDVKQKEGLSKVGDEQKKQTDSRLTQPTHSILLELFKYYGVPEELRGTIEEVLQQPETKLYTRGSGGGRGGMSVSKRMETVSKARRRVYDEIARDSNLRRKLMQLFYYDFILFGFPLPESS